MRSSWTFVITCSLMLLSIQTQILAGEQSDSRPDITELSLEELASQIVTSAGKKEQRLSRTAAAVYVITQEDISRSGFTSIPELLRMVPGLQVARIDSNKWAIGSRGFNGLFSNKLLVLIDGRSVYSPLFSGVYWDLQDMVLEDVERIEVIRGPGASLWGANAVNGVINVITKRARDTQGGLITMQAGNEDRAIGAVRYGTRLGKSAHARFYTKHLRRDNLANRTGLPEPEGWEATRGGFRMDWDLSKRNSVTLQGDMYDSDAGQQATSPTFQPPFSSVRRDEAFSDGGNILARWTHQRSETSEITFQIYHDRFRRRDSFVNHAQDTTDFDLQYRFQPAARHDFIWGLGYRLSSDGLQPSPQIRFSPMGRDMQLFSAFANDEILIVEDKLSLTVGTKVERNDFTGFEVQPNSRLLWTPAKEHSFWAAFSRAVRLPNRAENDISLNYGAAMSPAGLPVLITLSGNPHARSEVLWAYEAGYRVQVTPRVSFDLSGYVNDYDNVLSIATGSPTLRLQARPPHILQPVNFANNNSVTNAGLEIIANVTPRTGWKLSGGYGGLRTRPGETSASLIPSRNQRDNPAHQFNVRSQWDVAKSVELDAAIYYVGALPAIRIPSYLRADTRLAWRPRPGLEFSVVGQNLLDNRHPEFVPEALIMESEVRRSFYGKLTFRF